MGQLPKRAAPIGALAAAAPTGAGAAVTQTVTGDAFDRQLGALPLIVRTRAAPRSSVRGRPAVA